MLAWRMRWPSSASTTLGLHRQPLTASAPSSPRPSCPRLCRPQAHTSPSAVATTVCWSPHATCRHACSFCCCHCQEALPAHLSFLVQGLQSLSSLASTSWCRWACAQQRIAWHYTLVYMVYMPDDTGKSRRGTHMHDPVNAAHALREAGIFEAAGAQLPVLVAAPGPDAAAEADRGAEVLPGRDAHDALAPKRLHQRRPGPVLGVPVAWAHARARANSDHASAEDCQPFQALHLRNACMHQR
jgi:hypothetical protein